MQAMQHQFKTPRLNYAAIAEISVKTIKYIPKNLIDRVSHVSCGEHLTTITCFINMFCFVFCFYNRIPIFQLTTLYVSTRIFFAQLQI